MMILAMSLKVNKSWRKIVKWVVWSIIAILLLIFLVRVIVFENNYYSEKEGSERAAAIIEENTDLDETEPTADEIKDYKVAPDRPRYLSIEKLGVKNARVLPMSVNTSGELDTPVNIFDVGWYVASGKPGQGGTLMIDGHNGGPHVHGVFKNLPDLAKGDIIKVERGDGAVFKYKVVENVTVPIAESDAYMVKAAVSPEVGRESVTLISCTGEWSQSQRTYLSRQFTRAVLIED